VVDFGGALNLGFDFGGGGSNGVDALDAGAEEIVEDGIVAALVFAAENQVNVAGERFEGLDGGIDVGGFGIVVVIDAGDFGDEFEAVLYGLEISDSVANLFGRAAGR